MKPTHMGEVPPVRIEVENEWAWCGPRRLQLMPRAFAVLRHLVDHAGRLITKDALLAAVWRDVVVSDAALTTCIRDLRKALGDSSEAPRYIETVPRRGFRFVGPIAGPGAGPHARVGTGASGDPVGSPAPPTLVGRDPDLARLHERLGRALNGQRQLVFVTGEPGIGKTALVEAFVAAVLAGAPLRIGRGQCVEQYGAGEAYLPILEALGRLGRDAPGDQIVRVLRQHAPTWLVQLPALVAEHDMDAVQRRAQGATRERMLRELVEGLDALTVESPLLLILEDLHWSDSATIDLLAMLARRREASRLLVLGTYRPADVAVADHPLKAMKRELELHGQCEEIALEFLSVDAVAEYLSRRFGGRQWPADFVRVLHRRTDGNPLFLVNAVDDLLAGGQLREVDGEWGLAVPVKDLTMNAPETLWQIVEKQIERLTPDERAMLAIASVAGAEFSAAVATADGIDGPEAERRCEALARRGQFLQATGVAEWPDGTVASRYAFIHALYQHVLYARVPVGHRVSLHARTGERLERAYGPRAGEIASELAMHFAQGRDFERGALYRREAAEHALRQYGYREAAEHATQGLALLEALPDSQEHRQQELTLQVMLGSALTALKGHTVPEVEQAYARARELSERVDDTPRLFPVMPGLGWFYLVRGPSDAAHAVATRLSTMAETTGDPAILVAAHNATGLVAFYRGEFEAALDHTERGIARYDPTTHRPARSPALPGNIDPGVSCTRQAAWTLWVLGYPARAAARMREALALAHSIGHPFSLAHAQAFAAAFHVSRREPEAVQAQADAAVALSIEHGFGAVLKGGRYHQGWVRAEQGEEDGLGPMREWAAICQDTRTAILIPPYLAWLAEAYAKLGHPAEGLALVRDALAAATDSGYPFWTAELHRLKGALTLQAGSVEGSGKSRTHHGASVRTTPRVTAPGSAAEENAESCFLEALALARRQRAKLFELRAATSVSRLWGRQGRARDAQALLSEVYGWFVEGFDTADLTEAKALLEELDRGASARPQVGSKRASRASPIRPLRGGKA
jgi:predicted ATPase